MAPWRVVARGDAIDVPLLVGANSNEASVLVAMGIPPAAALGFVGPDVAAARQAYGGGLEDAEFARQILGDAFFVALARWMAAQTADGAPSWLYHFDYVATSRRGAARGAAHGSEIPYVFGTLDYLASVTGPLTDDDQRFSAGISSCGAEFVRTHRGGCPLVADWPVYAQNDDAAALFAPASGVVRQLRKQQIDLLLQQRFGIDGE